MVNGVGKGQVARSNGVDNRINNVCERVVYEKMKYHVIYDLSIYACRYLQWVTTQTM